MSDKLILVTGWKGFIGQNMMKYLKDYTPFVYDWNETLTPEIEPYDWVIHLGAISSTTETDVDKVMSQNYEFSVWVYEQCKKFNVNLQYSSSASIYGQTTHFDEIGPANPESPYAWSKYMFDRYVGSRFGTHKNTVQGFRYFNVYGQHEDHKGDQASPYHKFKKQAIEDGEIKIFEGSDKFKRDFVCVDDICYIHEEMMKEGDSGIFNVGTGKAVSFLDVAKSFSKKYNVPIKEIPFPDKLKGQYQEFTQANLSRLNQYITEDWIDIREYIENE